MQTDVCGDVYSPKLLVRAIHRLHAQHQRAMIHLPSELETYSWGSPTLSDHLPHHKTLVAYSYHKTLNNPKMPQVLFVFLHSLSEIQTSSDGPFIHDDSKGHWLSLIVTFLISPAVAKNRRNGISLLWDSDSGFDKTVTKSPLLYSAELLVTQTLLELKRLDFLNRERRTVPGRKTPLVLTALPATARFCKYRLSCVDVKSDCSSRIQ